MKPLTSISVTEFARGFSRFIHRVAFDEERFLLLKGGRPVAEVSPPPRGRRMSELKDLFAGLPHLSPEEATTFARDIEMARTAFDTLQTEDPWES